MHLSRPTPRQSYRVPCNARASRLLRQRGQKGRRRNLAVSADLRVSFRVKYHVHYGERMAILGSSKLLGNWKIDKAVPLKWTNGDVWVKDCTFENK